MVNMVNPEPIEVREKPMTEEEFNRKGLFGGVVPPRFRIPGKWRMGLPKNFRILQWFYPRDSSPRTGVFEFLEDPYDLLCQRVFIWQQGSPIITCVPRPQCLPPPPPPAREKVGSGKVDDAAQERDVDIACQRSVEIAGQKQHGYAVVKRQDMGAAAKRPSLVTARLQSVDSGYKSCTSVTNHSKSSRYLFADVKVQCTPRHSVLTYSYTADLRPEEKPHGLGERPETKASDAIPTSPQDKSLVISPHTGQDRRSEDLIAQRSSKSRASDTKKESLASGDVTRYDFLSSSPVCLPAEVPQIARRYLTSEPDKCKLIGRGAFGSVSLATYQFEYPRTVAVKTFIKGKTRPAEVLMEARILCLLNTTNFIPEFYGVTPTPEAPGLALVQECFGKGTTLFTVLNNGAVKSTDTWLYICLQLAVGLREIHHRGVLINDIKEDNVLVDSIFIIKYIDFGFATYKKGCVHQIEEDAYDRYPHIAPEARRGQVTTPSSDIFSLGVMLETIMAEGMIQEIWDVVSSCTEELPEKRPKIGQLVSQLRAIRECLDDDLDNDT